MLMMGHSYQMLKIKFRISIKSLKAIKSLMYLPLTRIYQLIDIRRHIESVSSHDTP